MADNQRLICSSTALVERGQGVRFPLPEAGERVTGFVVRFDGVPRAFINRCAHVPVELDWQEGDFFDVTRHFLICATHGAHYDPRNGECRMGPCVGRALMPLEVVERDQRIYLILRDGNL